PVPSGLRTHGVYGPTGPSTHQLRPARGTAMLLKTRTRSHTRSMGLVALALTASMGLAACGTEDPEPSSADDTTSSSTPSESPMTEEAMASGPFGPGCSAVPTEGEGSVEGMSDDPVATAASNNPLLGTLVTAVTEADLVDTLN